MFRGGSHAVFHPVPACPVPARPAPPVPAPDASLPDALPPEAVRAVAGLLGEGRVVAHRPCFARVFGGAACGLLLSQFWFWSGTPTVRRRDGGWFWKSQREITEETGLTRAETETARRRLCALGVLEEERRGLPATLHFRLDLAAVQRRLWTHVQAQIQSPVQAPPAGTAQTGLRGNRTLVRGILAGKCARSPQTMTEITPETTPKKTQTGRQPGSPAALGEPKKAILLNSRQRAVNRSGAAGLKAALDAARQASVQADHPFSPDGSPSEAGRPRAPAPGP